MEAASLTVTTRGRRCAGMARGAALLACLLLLAPLQAEAASKIWVGTLESLELVEQQGRDAAIEVTFVEDESDGRFGRYEFERATAWQPIEKPLGVKLSLDGVFPGKLLGSMRLGAESGLIEKVVVDVSRSSLQEPNLQATAGGRELEHAQIVIVTRRPTLIKTELVKNDADRRVTLRFTVSERGEAEPRATPTNFLEFSTESFDQPANGPAVLPFSTQARRYIDETLSVLSERDQDDYVTAIYPVQYADAATLTNVVRSRLSLLGRIDLDRDRSTIIVTDRVRFTRSVIETLLSLDRRPPQVTIVAQIVEVNRSAGSKIGVDFSYLGSPSGSGLGAASLSSSGLLGQSAILSGVYENLSGGALGRFAADVNLLIQQRLARVAAQPVLRIVNNARGVFNAGEQIPFFLVNSKSGVTRTSDRATTSDLDRVPGAQVLDSGAPLVLGEARSSGESTRSTEARLEQRTEILRTGVRLTVTPALRNSDEALLTIEASYNELVGGENAAGRPRLSERSVNTRIRVRQGETIVLGGLYREAEVKQVRGVPVLCDIPGIGRLFKTETTRRETYDIIFILTAFIQHD